MILLLRHLSKLCLPVHTEIQKPHSSYLCCNTRLNQNPKTMPILLAGKTSGRKQQRKIYFFLLVNILENLFFVTIHTNLTIILNPRSSQPPSRGVRNRNLSKPVCIWQCHPFLKWHIMPQPYPSINLNYQTSVE